MRAFSAVIMATVILTFALFSHAQKQQTEKKKQDSPDTSTTDSVEPHLKGKLLVKKLPVEIEALEIKDGLIRLKPGFKTYSNPNGTFALARANNTGGNGVEGSWRCICNGHPENNGSCDTKIEGPILSCQKSAGSNCNDCILSVKVGKLNTNLAIY